MHSRLIFPPPPEKYGLPLNISKAAGNGADRYTFPKRFVSIRTKDVKQVLTDEQRADRENRIMRRDRSGMVE